MTSRRYGDEEVREIFSLATTEGAGDPSLPAESGGLTLDDLQRIGREVGIEPARVAQAAAALEARGTASPVRRSFGLPIGVSRVVELPRAPTDREWEQLVSLFRATFATRGKTTTSGGLREWSQGRLFIAVEPTAHGEQLRLSTTKSDAAALNRTGLLMSGMSVIMSAVLTAEGRPDKALAIFSLFGGVAVTMFGINVFRLPSWARERERQMKTIAEQAVRLLSTPSD